MFKLPHIALISHASKVMLKILQARIQQYVNHELPDVQAGFILFYFFKIYLFLFIYLFILNFKIFNSYMRSQTWTPLPPTSWF